VGVKTNNEKKLEGLLRVEKQRGQGGLLGHFPKAQRAKGGAATRVHVLPLFLAT
jgi:hypothetical protein